MSGNLSQYGKAKVEAVLRVLDRAWNEAWEKEHLKPDAPRAGSNSKEIHLLNRHLASWLKRERLNNDDLSSIFDRLENEDIILDHSYIELDEEEKSPYFSESYHLVTLPADFEERSAKYLQSFADLNPPSPTEQRVVRHPHVPRNVGDARRAEVAISIVMVPILFIHKVLWWIWLLVWKFVRDIATYTYGHTVKIIGTVIAFAAIGYFASLFF
ncbi:MAG: hypothetical protein UW55_C0010G0027 [Candidatus Giovannonibacteria bacterium GW2011_GWA2_44_26]|uniref:Uncharacterized protein n=1 Tax=Candidatus Giovannonibacteria bacterium GW2011_GWA2_44_26 TaxID=1618648 RepID=A0A0G1IUN9_9BACT|nr:MAG: hypothetical protein UW55_C0010G0027 [Candidatus Giovannonibacteria bacterium GW2011_GWA2_44_26]